MPQFSFNLDRSRKREHQLPGVFCDVSLFTGSFGKDDEDAAWAMIERMLFVPGRWTCRLITRNRSMLATKQEQRVYDVGQDGSVRVLSGEVLKEPV